jgi:hypothetical protein
VVGQARFERNCDRDVATDRWAASTEIRKGEFGCLFDEIGNLVERSEAMGVASRLESRL